MNYTQQSTQAGLHFDGGLINGDYKTASLNSFFNFAFGSFGGHVMTQSGASPLLSYYLNYGMETNFLWISNNAGRR